VARGAQVLERIPRPFQIFVKSIHLPVHLLYPLLAATPLVLGGCSGAGGVSWGEEAGGGGAPMANNPAAASGATVRTGAIAPEIIGGAVAIIAEHEATERQRQVAAEHGRAWVARRVASSKMRKAVRKHRYIAVDTESDSRTSPQARKSVMIFDTEAQQVVGKNVYDVQSPPPVGAVARFETYSAQYVGPGF
jgi:hypothetical protein